MHSARKLLTQFHNDLYSSIGDISPSHITLNFLSKSLSGQFRIGFEDSTALVTFAITSKRCIGSLVVEADGEYWIEPKSFTWNTLEDYLDLFQCCPTPDELSWKTLLRPFTSVEIVRLDTPSDEIEILNISGKTITGSKKLMKHLEGFD